MAIHATPPSPPSAGPVFTVTTVDSHSASVSVSTTPATVAPRVVSEFTEVPHATLTGTPPTAPAATTPTPPHSLFSGVFDLVTTILNKGGVSAGTTAATVDPKNMSADQFFKMSNHDLEAAVRDGKIPDSVKDDPDQMRRLQQRMNDISEMNQLMTSMIQALHQMNQSIIQNVRV